MTLNCIYWQTEEAQASAFLPTFEGSVGQGHTAKDYGQGQLKYLVKIGRIEIILGLRHPNIRIENNPRIEILGSD